MTITINGDTGIAGVDGSNTTPTLVGNDLDTGVFFPAANTVALATNGLTRFQAGPSGQLGIGGATYGTSAGQVIRSGGASAAPAWTDAIVQGTAVASTSGTSIDFSGATGIPSWAKRVTVMLNGVSTSGTSIVQVQLGSTTFTTTGYSQIGQTTALGGGATTSNASTGFIIAPASIVAASIRTGTIIFSNISSNTWICFGAGADTNGGSVWLVNGSIGLAGVLDRVRVTTVNGTDTFDAGSINIMYE